MYVYVCVRAFMCMRVCTYIGSTRENRVTISRKRNPRIDWLLLTGERSIGYQQVRPYARSAANELKVGSRVRGIVGTNRVISQPYRGLSMREEREARSRERERDGKAGAFVAINDATIREREFDAEFEKIRGMTLERSLVISQGTLAYDLADESPIRSFVFSFPSPLLSSFVFWKSTLFRSNETKIESRAWKESERKTISTKMAGASSSSSSRLLPSCDR